ncbi:hypothetical protein [Paractinoplanes lichenicola]|uniref:Uncharacterized protein n=1 Tax=Paractinoplanes lichenicola TaxID=2802976 RepID=A0ABS1VZ45_9ACTN|nr:hypothetical protein [Actinoplanes lichenicola]MBL7259766.1 hypothetical protein [Actinoplanes lichenicola]
MDNRKRSSVRRPGGGPGRLPTHRLVLAMALISTAPPLVIHEGWRGVLVAVAAVFYATYLLLGKRWPRLRRRRPVSPTRPGRLPSAPAPPPASAPPVPQPVEAEPENITPPTHPGPVRKRL